MLILLAAVLALPEALEAEYEQELAELEEETQMAYLSRMERRAMARGREEGALEMARGFLLEALATRFGELPPATAARIEETGDLETLRQWLRRAVTAASLAEFEQALGASSG